MSINQNNTPSKEEFDALGYKKVTENSALAQGHTCLDIRNVLRAVGGETPIAFHATESDKDAEIARLQQRIAALEAMSSGIENPELEVNEDLAEISSGFDEINEAFEEIDTAFEELSTQGSVVEENEDDTTAPVVEVEKPEVITPAIKSLTAGQKASITRKKNQKELEPEVLEAFALACEIREDISSVVSMQTFLDSNNEYKNRILSFHTYYRQSSDRPDVSAIVEKYAVKTQKFTEIIEAIQGAENPWKNSDLQRNQRYFGKTKEEVLVDKEDVKQLIVGLLEGLYDKEIGFTGNFVSHQRLQKAFSLLRTTRRAYMSELVRNKVFTNKEKNILSNAGKLKQRGFNEVLVRKLLAACGFEDQGFIEYIVDYNENGHADNQCERTKEGLESLSTIEKIEFFREQREKRALNTSDNQRILAQSLFATDEEFTVALKQLMSGEFTADLYEVPENVSLFSLVLLAMQLWRTYWGISLKNFDQLDKAGFLSISASQLDVFELGNDKKPEKALAKFNKLGEILGFPLDSVLPDGMSREEFYINAFGIDTVEEDDTAIDEDFEAAEIAEEAEDEITEEVSTEEEVSVEADENNESEEDKFENSKEQETTEHSPLEELNALPLMNLDMSSLIEEYKEKVAKFRAEHLQNAMADQARAWLTLFGLEEDAISDTANFGSMPYKNVFAYFGLSYTNENSLKIAKVFYPENEEIDRLLSVIRPENIVQRKQFVKEFLTCYASIEENLSRDKDSIARKKLKSFKFCGIKINQVKSLLGLEKGDAENQIDVLPQYTMMIEDIRSAFPEEAASAADATQN